MQYLKGKVAIVSGAATGLGRSFAHALAAQGASVTVFDTDDAIFSTARELEKFGHGVLASVADVSCRADCERVVAATIAQFGEIDILVNNAGRWQQTALTDSWENSLADFDEIMNTNVKGVMLMSRLCARQMLKRGGDIVNVTTSSVLPARTATPVLPGMDVYCASKWALNGLTDAGAQWLRKDNIRVNALAVGATDTPMQRKLFQAYEGSVDEPGTWLKPEQVAGLLIDLLKDGRSGENVGLWPCQPIVLGPRKRWDVRMRERADFTGRPLRVYGAPPWSDALEPVEHLAVDKE